MKKIYTSSIFVNFANFAKSANFAKFATGYFARIAAMLLMLITMSVGKAWAEKGFNDSGTFNVKMYVNGAERWLYGTSANRTGVAEVNLGEVTSLTFGGYWINTWSDNNWTKSNVKLYASIGSGSFENWSVDGNTSKTGNSIGNETYTFTRNTPKSIVELPGTYVIRFYFALDDYRYATNTSGQNSPGEPYYVIRYSIAGPSCDRTPTFTMQSDVNDAVTNVAKSISVTGTSNCNTYAWSCTSSNAANVTFSAATSATTNFTATAAGTYTVKMTATSDCGNTTEKTCTITVSAPLAKLAGHFIYNGWSNIVATDAELSGNYETVTIDGNNLIFSDNKCYFAFTKATGTGWDQPNQYNVSGANDVEVSVDGASVQSTLNVSKALYITNSSSDAADYNYTFKLDVTTLKVYVTRAAKATYTVTVNNGDHGTVSPNGNQSVGASGITITATPTSGYTFVRWDVIGGAVVASSTAATTTLTATADGTVTAVFAEGLTSSWYISGVASPFGGWGTGGIQMNKVSENVYSAEVVAPSATPGDDDYQFKIYNGSTGEYWDANGYWITRENYHPTLEQDNEHANMKFKPDMLGTYTFTLDCTGASPVLTVTYPCKPTGWKIDFTNGAVEDMPMVDNGDGTFKLTFYISNDNATFKVSDGCTTYTINATKDEHSANLDGTLVESTHIMGYDGGRMNFVTATIDGDHFTLGAATPEDIQASLSAEIENPVREAGSSTIHFQNIVAKVPAGLSGVKIAVYELNSDNVSGGTKQTFTKDLAVTATEHTTTAQTFEAGHTYYYCLALFQEGRPQVYSQVLTITIPAYKITYGPCTSGHGSVSGTVPSGSNVNVGDVITLTATPDAGYYLKGWYGVESGDDQRLAYATMATNYQYQVTVAGNEAVYAKFEAIPGTITLDGNINERSWNNRLNPTSAAAGVYTWEFAEPKANGAKEFCFKGNANDKVVLKPNTSGCVTYAQTGCTSLDDSGDPNYNFRLTNDEKLLTITVTYGSGVHVQVDAVDIPIEIISIATSPATPQEGTVVTVTPTISGPAGATVYYCWTLKNGGVDTGVAFTNNGDGTFSFTAPAAGNYTIHLEVKPGDDCAGEAYDTKDQDFRVYGDNLIIYAGTEAGWKEWEGITAVTASDLDGKSNQVQLAREDIGEDSYGRHWFMFTLPISDTNGYLVLYNSYDEWPSTEIGSARTATLEKPTEDMCYIVMSEKEGAYDNHKVRTDICPAEPTVTITSPAHVIKEGTYAITTKTIMIPGEISYTYTVTDPDGAAVSVSADGKFTASKVGTYHVQVTATGSAGISATSDVLDVVCEEASLTASVSPTTTSAGATVELTATPTGFGTPDYQWFVQKPGSATYVEMDGYTEVSGKYVPNQTGSYVFQVKATENGVTKQATCTLTVSTQNYYLKHNTGSGWVCNQMTYNASEGNYWIKAIYYGAGINIHTECSDWLGVMPYYRFVEEADNFTFEGGEDTYTKGDEVFYFFNPMTTHITVQKANTNSYRIVSTSTKGEFYSNTVVLADASEQKEVSFFFAQDNGSLKLQKFGETGWVDQSLSLSTSAFTSNNVYKAKLDLTNGLTSVKVYSGYYYIFSALGSTTVCSNTNKMTAFNNINEEEYYNHYWCKWTEAENNTSATVGNEINHNLANALSSDTQSKMSVRYAYKPETNHFSRAYLRGSQDDDNFLKVFGENITAENGTVLNSLANSQVFMDGSDWVYTTYVKAAAAAYIKLAAHMQDDEYNYLLSASGSKDAKRNIYGVDGDFADELRFAIIYDFKTNRVISAWSPTGEEEFDHPVTVDADLLVVRKAINNSGITIFTLTGEGQVKLIRKIYTAIELNRDDIFESSAPHNYKSGLNKRLFQLSLPYNLDLLDVTGFLDYGTKMNLQVYSGELRALLGWQTYIETFWSNMAYQSSSKIQAQRGYVIQQNLDYDDFKEVCVADDGHGNCTAYLSRITLYFPSQTNPEGHIIGPTSRYETSAFAPLTCTKPGRDKIDSNWRCIGLPGFYPASAVAVDPETITGGTNDPATNIVTEFVTPRWVYDWNGSYMSYTAYRATNFRFMPTQNYMMQYAGSITWGEAVGSNTGGTTEYPSSEVAARRVAVSEQSEGEYCLRLTDESGEMLDQTFVVLDHKASDAYEMNMDLQKMVTNGAPQIYSVAGGQTLAAAAVCDTTTRVALGTNLPDGALYTFSLGEMTPNARVPYLYDAMTGTYTNLATDSYVFSETIGKQQGRFFLVFGYQAPQTPTGLDNVVNGFSATIVDGRVVLNGLTNDLVSLYDAAGRLLYEQHLGGNNTIALPMVGGVYMVRNGANTTKIVIR